MARPHRAHQLPCRGVGEEAIVETRGPIGDEDNEAEREWCDEAAATPVQEWTDAPTKAEKRSSRPPTAQPVLADLGVCPRLDRTAELGVDEDPAHDANAAPSRIVSR
jgi:hypothetical protein